VETARKRHDDAMLAWALRLDLMLHALIFTMSGLPILYSGDEIARENDASYHDDPLKADDSRYLHRGRMDWAAAERAKDSGTMEGRFFAQLRRLETLRAAHRVFDSRADAWIVDTGSDSVLGIGRYYDGEKLIGLFNFGEGQTTISVAESGEYADLRTGEPVDLGTVGLLPGEHRWLLCEF